MQASNITSIVPKTLSNKVGIDYDTKENKREYTLTIDRIILNLVPLRNEFEFNYSFIRQYPQQQDYYLISEVISLKKNSKRIEKNFLHTFSIYVDGVQVGELSTDSRIYNGSELIKLSFLNPIYYTFDWYNLYLTVAEALDLKLYNVSYVEIAYDGYDLHNRYKDLYLNSTICNQYDYKPTNTISISSLHNHSEFVTGSRNTGKAIAIYNKSLDIQDNNKGYIAMYHSLNGLDTSRQIDRVELRLKNDYIKKYNIRLEDLTTQAGLEAIFKLFTQDSLSFFDLNSKYYDSNRNKKYKQVDLIDYSLFNGKEFTKVDVKASTESSNRAIKNAYKRLLYNYIDTGKHEYYNALEVFISSPENYLTSTPFESFFGCMDLADTNKTEYRELTIKYIKQYDYAPTPEILHRLETMVDRLFYGFNPDEALIVDEHTNLPF